MEFLLVLLVLAFVPAAMAMAKGHNGLSWYVYGLFLFPFAMIHIMLTEPTDRERVGRGSHKQCKRCAELARAAAQVCPYCGHHDFVTEADAMS